MYDEIQTSITTKKKYIKYNNMFNIIKTKNVKDESTNKLITPKLIAYDDKMLTYNVINFKSLKYVALRRWNHKKHKMKNLICVKTTYLTNKVT